MHQHKFDTVIWRAEQRRVKTPRHAISDDDIDILVQRVIVRRCECGEIQHEKLEYPVGQDPTTGREGTVTP